LLVVPFSFQHYTGGVFGGGDVVEQVKRRAENQNISLPAEFFHEFFQVISQPLKH